MDFNYKTQGVCSRSIRFEIEDGKIHNINFEGGCDGNAQGVASLADGMDIDEVVTRIKGISCGGKGTSCPDQLATALMLAKEKLEA